MCIQNISRWLDIELCGHIAHTYFHVLSSNVFRWVRPWIKVSAVCISIASWSIALKKWYDTDLMLHTSIDLSPVRGLVTRHCFVVCHFLFGYFLFGYFLSYFVYVIGSSIGGPAFDIHLEDCKPWRRIGRLLSYFLFANLTESTERKQCTSSTR